jgi:hypothetical protein
LLRYPDPIHRVLHHRHQIYSWRRSRPSPPYVLVLQGSHSIIELGNFKTLTMRLLRQTQSHHFDSLSAASQLPVMILARL